MQRCGTGAVPAPAVALAAPVNAGRWQVEYPLGRTDSMRALGTVAAPLLGGFDLATLTLLATADRPPRLVDLAMSAVTTGAVLFLFCLQFTSSGLLFAATPAEREGWVGTLDASAAPDRLLDAQRKDLWLAARYFRRARWTYDLGLLATMIGIAAIVVPGRHGTLGGWISTGVVCAGVVVELVWIIGSRTARRPRWLLPGYRDAREALPGTDGDAP
ncbi:hypothetical protein [Streptomyces acidiscabies]|uniref:hypothetical protein n=1 Tax=Streptomyces acidiscabies TaxID=42234 RepID=UPI000287E9F3|nr:hypothetical protein [Streptomyces acidiscabies]MBZ3917978.1 hypothetical protein [Streptomyces acidiscabies]